jgi:hypothetical protein
MGELAIAEIRTVATARGKRAKIRCTITGLAEIWLTQRRSNEAA